MMRSHEELTDGGTKHENENQYTVSNSLLVSSEPTKKRSRLSLSKKQRMHWREQNEKQKSVEMDRKKKLRSYVVDYQIDEDALPEKVSKVSTLVIFCQ